MTVRTPRAIGLAMALAAAMMLPAAAVSQGKKDAAISDKARKQGMEEAPAVVQEASIPCQVSDARLIGEDKKAKTKYYEVACAAGAMGFVLQKPAEGAVTAYTCVEANTPPGPDQPPSAPCMLPGNSDPKITLQAMLKASGHDCLPEKARGIGQTKTSTYLEVACQDGRGFIVVGTAPFDSAKEIQAQNCLMYDEAETNIKCSLTDKATRMAVMDKYVVAANNGCAIKDRRFVGMSRDGATFYEASCQDGKGYIYKVAGGQLTDTYECSKASQILGGCELTDARQAQTEQAALYTKLASDGGVACDVERYALFPVKDPKEEIVELVCKDGSGAIGMFKAGEKGQVIDCGRAPVAGYKCSLSDAARAFTSLTSDLKKFRADTTCVVSDSRVIGKASNGTTHVEVACADKLKGYVIEYQAAPKVTAVDVKPCTFTGTCKLPGNT